MSHDEPTGDLAGEKIPTKTGDGGSQQSPFKKRKIGLTLAQKQALIEDLQLEITERARRLRSNYSIHAQTLRTRVEMRVTRISRRLRDITIGELIQKYSAQLEQVPQRDEAKGPPVPEKDNVVGQHPIFRRPLSAVPGSPARPPKRMSNEISGDKENDMATTIDMPKKKTRPGPAATDITRNPGQVLSPTSSNSRLNPRERPMSPAKSGIARPVSPTKLASATNLLSNMVEKARSTRAAATNRKTTTSTTASSTKGSTSTTGTATRGRRGAAAQPPSSATRPATRTARRVSAISESSDGSTSTVVRKRPATAMGAPAKAPPAKRTVISAIKKGVGATSAATVKKTAAATKAQATPAAGTGRVLRKRT